jgi:hypothetical protein
MNLEKTDLSGCTTWNKGKGRRGQEFIPYQRCQQCSEAVILARLTGRRAVPDPRPSAVGRDGHLEMRRTPLVARALTEPTT